MFDADEKICASKIIIYDWVKKAENDPVLYNQRRATEIVLNAIAMTETLSGKLFLKGGILMALKYKSPRNTGDIDFTISLDPHNDITTTLRNEINAKLPIAVTETGHVGFHLKVQTIKILPKENVTKKDADINRLGENIDVSRGTYGRGIGLPSLMLMSFIFE